MLCKREPQTASFVSRTRLPFETQAKIPVAVALYHITAITTTKNIHENNKKKFQIHGRERDDGIKIIITISASVIYCAILFEEVRQFILCVCVCTFKFILFFKTVATYENLF